VLGGGVLVKTRISVKEGLVQITRQEVLTQFEDLHEKKSNALVVIILRLASLRYKPTVHRPIPIIQPILAVI